MKTVWVKRGALMKNRARSIQYADPVIQVHDGVRDHFGFGLKILGESEFKYLNLNGRYALHLETDAPVMLEVQPGEWKTIP